MLVVDCHNRVIEDYWQDIATVAWSGYLNNGRGIVRVDTTKTRTDSTLPLMLYQPLSVRLEIDQLKLVNNYEPSKEVIVCVLDDSGQHTCKARFPEQTPPSVYSKSGV